MDFIWEVTKGHNGRSDTAKKKYSVVYANYKGSDEWRGDNRLALVKVAQKKSTRSSVHTLPAMGGGTRCGSVEDRLQSAEQEGHAAL